MNNKAFTLIELLVVVLIIGILASVALPQYQKAVEKSKAAQAFVVLRSVGQAIEAHMLAGNSEVTKFDELAIEIDWTGNQKGYTGERVTDTRSNQDWSLQLYKSPITGNRLYLTRLRGKYKGAAFHLGINDDSQGLIDGTVYCTVRTKDGVIFSGSPEDYCAKILHWHPSQEMATLFVQ